MLLIAFTFQNAVDSGVSSDDRRNKAFQNLEIGLLPKDFFNRPVKTNEISSSHKSPQKPDYNIAGNRSFIVPLPHSAY